jgi:transposase
LTASERNNHKRAWYWRRVKELCHRRLRFIDETGINVALTRRYGRSMRGERISEAVPKNYRQQQSIISSMGVDGVAAVFIIEGAVDTSAFDVYVERVLRPTMKAGDIFVLDNLTAHHASRIESVAHECTAQVLWLAPYSPDFSPIELLWSKIKAGLRKAKARTIEELGHALNKGLELITTKDCRAWFEHCGYSVASD